ncbi:MAG: GGDEF domain-containing protein [Pseudomonadota bacterium]
MQASILTFVIPAIAMIFAAVFGLLWWQDRTRLHIAAYGYCYAALGAGVMINIFILQSVTPFGIVAYHLLSMSGLIAMLWGTARRLGLKTPILAYSASVVFTSGILWAAIAAGERDAMMMAQNTNSSLLMALTAQNLWHAGSRRLADRAVIWVLALFCVFGFVRPLLTIFSDALFGPGEEGAALLMGIHVLVLAVFLTLQAVALIATVLSDKAETDRDLAAIDPLSGLAMRARFEAQAEELRERAREAGVPLTLIIADLDHFKRVNDTHGHAAGDRVIAAFGQLIAGELRPNDICGRIGGEEFCIMAYKCDAQNARALANRLRAATDRMMVPWSTQELVVTASFGVSQWDMHERYTDVFKRADDALYIAKRDGRDRVALAGERAQSDTDPTEPDQALNPNKAAPIDFVERRSAAQGS